MSDVSYDPASHYDRVTAAWTLLLGDDLHYGVFSSGAEPLPVATDALTALMIDASRLEPDLEVLDVGCGTGAPACRLATEHAVRVTGITTSAVGVASAKDRAATAGVADRVTFDERDGMDNGYPDASFDRTWVLESSHLMRERDRLISECARVLRPGGRMALCDVMLRRPMPFREVRRLREPLELLRAVFGEARMEPLATYADLARASGMEVDEERDLTAETRPTFTRWRENAERHHDEVVELLGAEDLQRFIDSTVVLEGFWDDGTLGYGIISASKR